ncbi:MAG: PhoX family phosphatase [Pseudomonadota bacterium]
MNTPSDTSDDVDFEQIVESALTRRRFLQRTFVLGSIAALSSQVPVSIARSAPSRFPFIGVPSNVRDDITLPKGYSHQVVVRWGDPLWSDGMQFDHATRGTAFSQSRALGDNVDGMELFVVNDRMLLVVNNEYTNRTIIWGNRRNGKFVSDDDVLKGKMAHGISIVELKQTGRQWEIIKDSPYNRRITPDTEMMLTGPAAGHPLLQTAADPGGMLCKGTWNNCGNGRTPWGTYLACEENFNGYFSATTGEYAIPEELIRYGVRTKDRGYGWGTIDTRFLVDRHPNEPNRAGYVVEIDPSEPDSTPKKRTALGRFKHENAELVVNGDGRVVVYMGDDERGEFLYRYVSHDAYKPGEPTDHLLDNGRLYAARFYENGTGEWLLLSPKTTGLASAAEVCIHTRQAASAVGATTMDRPEWVAAHPHAAEIYCALTNNKNRGVKPNAGGDETPVGGPNPRARNRYGQIVRWRPMDSDHTSSAFTWDLYVLAGNPLVYSDDRAGSDNISVGNMFNSPDGIRFDQTGLLWIQTDGQYNNQNEYEGHGNNQMLVGDPVTGEIRRFMVGPRECEITGMCFSPDRRTIFVGIQHPGERGGSHWPEGGGRVPRSTVIAIRRDDGDIMG